MSLLNVRLGPEEARAASELRGAGANLSEIVRRAIRAEYERQVGRPGRRRRPSKIVEQILIALPDPTDLPGRPLEARDRRAVRKHIAGKLGARR